MTVVVHSVRPSIHDAFQAVADTLPVSRTSVYNKLNGLEPAVSAGLVTHVTTRAAAVIDALGTAAPTALPGFEIRILDGNHLPATDRRLAVLQGVSAGPRPGFGLVVLDPQRRLPLRVVPVEDAYTQERAVLPEVLALVQPGTCTIGDRNVCTAPHCAAIHARHGRFLFREPANLPLELRGHRRAAGRVATGRVYVQRAWVRTPDDRRLSVRRVTLVLDRPTREGDTEIHVVTNLRTREATPRPIVEAYRGRWTIEGAFLERATVLAAEIKPLGYPRAALFGLCVGLASYAVLSTLRAALAAEQGADRVAEAVSSYHLATEARAGWEGLAVMTEPTDWTVYGAMTPEVFAQALRDVAAGVRRSRHGRDLVRRRRGNPRARVECRPARRVHVQLPLDAPPPRRPLRPSVALADRVHRLPVRQLPQPPPHALGVGKSRVGRLLGPVRPPLFHGHLDRLADHPMTRTSC
jgi:IS4 transposase